MKGETLIPSAAGEKLDVTGPIVSSEDQATLPTASHIHKWKGVPVPRCGRMNQLTSLFDQIPP